MSEYGYIEDALQRGHNRSVVDNITIGKVVDTNDPQQMGRVRVFCPALGDKEEKKIKDVPWATSVSPLAGITTFDIKGATESTNSGAIAYGMWNVPKVGAHVLVACIDGDSNFRVWLGCLPPQFLTHTMPHGRYSYQLGPGTPEGPLSTSEQPIQPLYDNLTSAFTNNASDIPGTPSDPRDNMEWRSRGADSQVSALSSEVTNSSTSPGNGISDDFGIQLTEEDGTERNILCNGYDLSQLEPTANYDGYTPGGHNYDNQVYSWTTPGFHSISMDDRSRNSRMRFRTTSGNQIILDDTNERIYVSTAEGQTWIEIDQKGNIDIFGQRNISIRSGGDINLTSDQTIRMHGKDGIHMTSEKDIRYHANNDISVIAGDNIRIDANNQYLIDSNEFHVATKNDMLFNSKSNIHFKSGNTMFITSGSTLHISSGGNILMSASPDIHLNGPTAKKASNASNAEATYAYMTSRIPEHEPWARVFANMEADQDDKANKYVPEYDYANPNVGRKSDVRKETYQRNKYWHR